MRMRPSGTHFLLLALFLGSPFPGEGERAALLGGEVEPEKGAGKGDRLAAPAPAVRSAPPIPSDPSAAELARALQEARKDHEARKAESDRESRELGEKVAEEAQAVLFLRDEEKKLLERLRVLESEGREVVQKLEAGAEAHRKAGEELSSAERELLTQAAAFRERFAGSLLAAEDPRILETAAEAMNAGQPLRERLGALLDGYERVLSHSRTASVLKLPVQLSDPGGRIERLSVLRVGLLGGYYSRPARKEGGFVLSDREAAAGFVAESRGLSGAEQAAIIALVQKPEKGGTLPVDVTGGAGLAALRERDTPRRWFERGGAWMWALLSIGVLGLLLIAERAVTLTLRSFRLGRRIDGVVSMVRDGRLEAAQASCARMKGAAGNVLGTALAHRDEERPVLEGAVQGALLRETQAFESRLGLISLCAALATLVGFLGTVSGMLGTFHLLAALGEGEPRLLTGGLSGALVATEAGLLIAIPCLFFRGILGALAERSIGKLEAGSIAIIIALLTLREAPLEVAETA